MSITVGLVVENMLRREGLLSILEDAPEIYVLDLVSEPSRLRAAVAESCPVVVIAETNGSDAEAGRKADWALEVARRQHWGVMLVGERVSASDARTLLTLRSSGRGYLIESKLRDCDQLLDAIALVAGGGSSLDPPIVDALVSQWVSEHESSPLSALTPREFQVLAEIATGRSNAAIAVAIGISKRAVEHHVTSIFRKCRVATMDDVTPRVAVALMYLRSIGATSHSSRTAESRVEASAQLVGHVVFAPEMSSPTLAPR